MEAPKEHKNEAERLKDLASYAILDTITEKDYDDITSIAAAICGTSISLISLVDDKRQWFKSHHGLGASETPKEYAFCAHAIHDEEKVFIIEDARNDERFHDNPLVTADPYVIFYAGVPLMSDNGNPLGTLCVINHEPMKITQAQEESLRALGRQTMNLLNLRKTKMRLEKTLKDLEIKSKDLERFAFIAAHDLKSPLIGISEMLRLFIIDHADQVNKEGIEMLKMTSRSSVKLQSLIDGILDYSKSDRLLDEPKSEIVLSNLMKGIEELFSHETDLTLRLNTSIERIITNRAVLEQVLINLVANAIKYGKNEGVEIEVGVSVTLSHYEFYVQDNGPGILEKNQDVIFDMFKVLKAKDKFGKAGHGIGLATVRKVIENSGGTIRVESTPDTGSRFIFTLEK
ncbi:MAG: ATP-binding protein [Cryomorphaceae bacterium]